MSVETLNDQDSSILIIIADFKKILNQFHYYKQLKLEHSNIS